MSLQRYLSANPYLSSWLVKVSSTTGGWWRTEDLFRIPTVGKPKNELLLLGSQGSTCKTVPLNALKRHLLSKDFLYLKLGIAAVLWACSWRYTKLCCYHLCSAGSHFSNQGFGCLLFFQKSWQYKAQIMFFWSSLKEARKKDVKTDFDCKEPAEPIETCSSTGLVLILLGCRCIS